MKRKNTVTLVTGGARSGKSSHALDLALKREKRVFIATAEAADPEMAARIERHRSGRGDSFETIEEPLDPAGALARLPAGTDAALIDCLTVWVGNLMHKYGKETPSCREISDFLEAVRKPPCELVIVTNETGMGIVPANEASRQYRDIAGRLNQDVATLADRVVFTLSGIPVQIK
ncbi:MAG: bifunctional adenosylcobinamide kinase/adenosylcobinamide-phosphate guanylyltransferase [Kiritimatiellia bacterium]